MSAEILRRAAALMRERAEAATPGPWRSWADGHVGAPQEYLGGIARPTKEADPFQMQPDAEHIASWHPAVALAVADWLDEVAWRGDHIPKQYRAAKHAFEVACAYLGESA